MALMTGWWNPLHVERHMLRTRLTPEQCRERLQARLDDMPIDPDVLNPWFAWNMFRPANPLVGAVTSRGFAVENVQDGCFFGNLDRVVVHGHFRRSSEVTSVTVRITLRRSLRLGTGLALVFATIGIAGAVYAVATGDLRGALGSLGIAVACLVPLALAVGSREARAWEAVWFMRFLRETLEAEEDGALGGPAVEQSPARVPTRVDRRR